MTDELTSALRALARDDAAPPLGTSSPLSPRLLAEFHRRYPARPGARAARWFGLAVAATLVSAIAVPMWLVSRGRAPEPRWAAASSAEVATAFLPLAYSAIPAGDAQIVRVEVPRAALGAFGLLPVDSVDSVDSAGNVDTAGADVPGKVLADVIVGEDGLARAVRFVRKPLPSAP